MSILNEIESILLTEVTNSQIIENFLKNEFPHNKDEAPKYGVRSDTYSTEWGTSNVKIKRTPTNIDQDEIGWSLTFFGTPILFRDNEGGLYFNTQKKMGTAYTKFRTTIDNLINQDQEAKKNIREVDENTIVKLTIGEKIDDSLLNKLSDEIPEPEPEQEIVDEPEAEAVPEETPEELPEVPEETEDVPEKTEKPKKK